MRKTALALALALAFGAGLGAQRLSIYTEDSPPYNFRGPDGKETGIGWDLVAEIQRRVGDRNVVRMISWQAAISELESKPNVVVFSMARSAEREAKYQWVGPLGEALYGFYALSSADLRIPGLDSARSLPRVGVYKADICEQLLSKAGFENLERTPDAATPFRMLLAGRIPVLAATPDEVEAMSRSLGFEPSELKLLYVFQRIGLFVAMSKAMPMETVREWRMALDEMRKDGTFEAIHRKYSALTVRQ